MAAGRGERRGAGEGPPAPRDLRQTGPNTVSDPRRRLVKVPYDPRFQRGPFDPCGRPGRLPGSMEPKSRPHAEQESVFDDEGAPMPEGLFVPAEHVKDAGVGEDLVLDEAHHIKNFRSQRWQTLLNFNSKRRLLLTGRRVPSSVRSPSTA